MTYNRDIHHRRSIRLRDYDYSRSGAYFVTLCTLERECLFGEVVGGGMCLNEAGRCVEAIWIDLSQRYPEVETDAFVVMPNHVHGIIMINPVGAIHELPRCHESNNSKTGAIRESGAIHESPLQGTMQVRRAKILPKAIGYLKMNSARQINSLRGNQGVPLWQRNYYERVIRDEDELGAIRQYIADNPSRWAEDENHPARFA